MYRAAFIGTYTLSLFLISIILLYDWLFGMTPVWKITLIVLSLLIALEPEFRRAITSYRFEVERMVKEVGLLTKKRVEVPYSNIAQIIMRKSIMGRILNYGDVIIIPTSGINSSLVLSGLKEPEKYVKLIERKMKKFKK